VTLDIVVVETAARRPPLSASDFIVTDDGETLPVESVSPGPAATRNRAPSHGLQRRRRENGRCRRRAGWLASTWDEYHLGDDAAFAVARDA
jgi:hypothetical protein